MKHVATSASVVRATPLRAPLLALVCILLSVSCASTPPHLYTLRMAERSDNVAMSNGVRTWSAPPSSSPAPTPQSASDPAAKPFGATLRVLSVSVASPDALDRTQWVLRQGEREVQVLDQLRWPQPLSLELADALAQRLDRRMPAGWAAIAGADGPAAVKVRVLSFDAWWSPARVSDEFTWDILCRGKDGARLAPITGRTRYATAGALGAGAEVLAAEHARALDQLAVDIAEAWRLRTQAGAAC